MDVSEMESSTQVITIKQPGRLIVVEPVLVIASLFGFPLMIISQLYVLETLQNELASKNGMLNISHDVNISTDLCELNASDPLVAFNAEVQEAAAYFGLMSTVCSCVPALFISLFLGAYSDKVGRKYAIMPPLISSMLKTVIYIIVVMLKLPMWYLLVASVVDGFGGYFSTMFMGCFSYISDTTTKEQRRFRITVLEICMLLPGIIGPLGVGKLLETIGFLYCFIITIIGQAINIIYAIFFIPETIQKDPSAKFFDFAHVRRASQVFCMKDSTNRNVKLMILLAAFFISIIPTMDFSLDTLFMKDRPLCLSDAMVGYCASTYLAVAAIGALVMAWLFKYCLSDQAIAMVAGMASVFKNVYKAFTQNVIMIFMTPFFGMFSILYVPTIRTLMSVLVTESEQGTVFGVIACAEVLCSIIGAAIFNPIYASTQDYMTGFVYITMAIFYLVGCGILLIYVVKQWNEKKFNVIDHDSDEFQDQQNLLDSNNSVNS